MLLRRAAKRNWVGSVTTLFGVALLSFVALGGGTGSGWCRISSRCGVDALPRGRRISVSIGAADWPEGAPFNDVIHRADAALCMKPRLRAATA